MTDRIKEVEELAVLFGQECCMNEEKTKPCLNCIYKAGQVIRFGYARSPEPAVKIPIVCPDCKNTYYGDRCVICHPTKELGIIFVRNMGGIKMGGIDIEDLSNKVFKTICQRLCCRGKHKGYDGFRCFFCGKATPTEHDNFCRACMTEIPAIIAEGYYKILQPVPSHLEPPDYKTPLDRALLSLEKIILNGLEAQRDIGVAIGE